MIDYQPLGCRKVEVTFYDDVDSVDLNVDLLDVQVGEAVVRESKRQLPNANGEVNRTKHVGARPVAIQVRILDDQALVARVMRFADPAAEWKLRLDGFNLWPTVEADARSNGFAPEFSTLMQLACGQVINCNITIPGGLMYGVTPQVLPIDLSLTGQTGRVYNRDHNWRYGYLPLSGAVRGVITSGWYKSYPVVTLQGTLSAPVISNMTTGESLSLPALELTEDETAVVDFGAQTVTVGGRQADSVVDKETARWWSIRPGVATTIRVTSAAAAAPANATVVVRDAYL